jgi:hypothetical protein
MSYLYNISLVVVLSIHPSRIIIIIQQQWSKTLVNALQKQVTDNLIPPYLTINEQVMNKTSSSSSSSSTIMEHCWAELSMSKITSLREWIWWCSFILDLQIFCAFALASSWLLPDIWTLSPLLPTLPHPLWNVGLGFSRGSPLQRIWTWM